MSTNGPGELRRLFDLVCDLPTEHRRARLHAEGADAETIAEIEALVASQGTLVARARVPVADLLGGGPETELDAGDRVGAWRLLKRIASGGMGAVYLAERADGHFEQLAAVKLIRGLAGTDTFALFARERQILATLQHPNIARLLDGGATPGGQPYLVMEYVEGLPIDRYCDEHRLGLRERLDLFRSVCAAVQFAHQRLIVHCDLKPSNVLVRVDGTPVLLDFGIARALDRPRVADSDGAHYFTPGYASPEQLRDSSVTTASDVYALGLVLFELVTGRKARIDTADHTVSQLARAEVRPSELVGDVPWRARIAGDLDAIVLRATADQPAERYASAQALADDLGRFLEHRPVLARPQTLGYRVARGLRRRWPLALAAAAALLLVFAFTWRLAVESARARAAEQDARQQALAAERVSDFLVSVFNVSNPKLNANREISAREVLDQGAARIESELEGAPDVRARLLDVLATAYRHLGQPRRSIELFRSAIELYLDPRVARPLAAAEAASQLAVLYANNQYPAAEARAMAQRSLDLRRRHAPDDALALADSWNTLGVVLESQDDFEAARTALQKALVLRRETGDRLDLASTLHNLGLVARNSGDGDGALTYFGQALELKRDIAGEHSVDFQTTLQGYAVAMVAAGRIQEAVPLLERNVALCAELYGDGSGTEAVARNELGSALHDLGRYDEAIAQYRMAMRMHAASSGEDSAQYAIPLNNLASALEDSGDAAAALPLFERSLATRRKTLPDNAPAVLRARQNLARLLTSMGRLDDAQAPLQAALEGFRVVHGEDHASTAKAELILADWALRRGDAGLARATLALLERSRAPFTPLMQARREEVAGRIAALDGDPAAALAHHRRAFESMREHAGPAHPLLAEFALDYADALDRAGRASEATAIVESMRAVIESSLAPDAPARTALARRDAGTTHARR